MTQPLGPYDLLMQLGDIVPLPASLPFHCWPGQTVISYCSVYSQGTPDSYPTSIEFTVTDPNGNVNPVTVSSPALVATGTFQVNIVLPTTATVGVWTALWQTSGQAYEGAVVQECFYVDPLGFSDNLGPA
jgi:hypothetical protein